MQHLKNASRWITAAKNRQGEASRLYDLQTRDAENRRKLVLAEVVAAIHYLDTARRMLTDAQMALLPVPADEES